MHCVGEYPTPIENSNLNRIKLLQQEFPDIEIKQKNIEGVLRVVVMRILDELNLLNEENNDKIEKLLACALKLLVTTVKQKSFWSKLCKCCSPKK